MMKKVLLFLANGFEVLEASAFIDVTGWNLVIGDGSTELYSCGLHKEVKSSFDQRFIVDYLIDEIDANSFDALAIPGGFEEYNYYQDAFDERFLDLIREFNRKDKIIASICVAALPVGKSGVLKNKEGTTYKSIKRQEALKGFGVNVIDKPIVITDNIITSCGPSTAIDVGLLLLELLTTKTNSSKIRQLMGFDNK
jgi:4-methyl-5(b-hydroxyethyl)-thiazole monophosphate biosynthesis